MQKLKSNAQNIQTTIMGIVTVLITVLVGFGKISADDGVQVESLFAETISSIAGLALIFMAKD